MNKVNYFNIKLNNNNLKETLSICQELFDSNQNNLIFFINAHCFNIAQKNNRYRGALNKVRLLLNDGIGIKLGALFLGIKIKENMNKLPTDKSAKIVVYCRSGNMSQNAANELIDLGYSNVLNLEGGIKTYNAL